MNRELIKQWACLVNENCDSDIKESEADLKPGSNETYERFVIVRDLDLKENGLPSMFEIGEDYGVNEFYKNIEEARKENEMNISLDASYSGRICKVSFKIEVVE